MAQYVAVSLILRFWKSVNHRVVRFLGLHINLRVPKCLCLGFFLRERLADDMCHGLQISQFVAKRLGTLIS